MRALGLGTANVAPPKKSLAGSKLERKIFRIERK
jgi:hypothetical protein